MKAYFEKFGEVADCVVMKDSTTSRPRGFGFVKFKDPSCVNLVLSQSAHMLDNKKVSVSCPSVLATLFSVCVRVKSRFHVDNRILGVALSMLYGSEGVEFFVVALKKSFVYGQKVSLDSCARVTHLHLVSFPVDRPQACDYEGARLSFSTTFGFYQHTHHIGGGHFPGDGLPSFLSPLFSLTAL